MRLLTYDTNSMEWDISETSHQNNLEGLVGYIESQNSESCDEPMGLRSHQTIYHSMIGVGIWTGGRDVWSMYIIITPEDLTPERAGAILDEVFPAGWRGNEE